MNSILIHGATNCGSSNYGDFIYIDILYNHIASKHINAYIWQPSCFFLKWVKGYIDSSKRIKLKSDTLLYAPGGYFGEGHNARLRDNIVHFLRFMPIGLLYKMAKKNICVVAIGAGPNKNALLRIAIRAICSGSKFISVRDTTSFQSIKTICPRARLYNYSDLIIASSTKMSKSPISKVNQHLLSTIKGKKVLLIHFNNNTKALELFAKTSRSFLDSHKEYYPIVTSDNVLSNEIDLFNKFVKMIGVDCGHFIYNDPNELTTLLSIVNVVLTSKLHVGVVSSMFGKSVIVAASHPEKTKRFYSQIGEERRCVSLYNTNKDELLTMLNCFHDKTIHIPKKIIQLADKSWNLIDTYIDNMKKQM